MARPSAVRLAQGAILVLLLALLRTTGEYFRLRATLGAEAGLRAFAPFVGGLLLGLLGLGAGTLLYFAGRFRAAAAVVAVTLAALLAYKLRVIGY